MPLEFVSEDLSGVVNSLRNFVGGPADLAVQRSHAFSNVWQKERERFLNATTITIPADVKRVAVLNELVRAFARRAVNLRVLASVFQNVPLQGTDEIAVSFFPLQAGASKDWDSTKGYEFAGAATQESRKITVNKRKYQAIDFGSDTFRRQPMFNAVQLGEMNAEKLAYDAMCDIMSVVTLANYGDAGLVFDPAAIDSDDVITVQGVCNDAHWPNQGRGLLVDSSVNTQLQRDSTYKLALNIGGTEVVRGGKLPNISGFEYAWMPAFPDNGEKLIGMAVHMSAIGCAFCPVDPAREVRDRLSAYEIATDPTTGISMNYRAYGDAQLDRAFHVIETAYGYAKLNAAGLKRITKP